MTIFFTVICLILGSSGDVVVTSEVSKVVKCELNSRYVAADYTLKNKGESTVAVKSAKGDCGCTLVDVMNPILAPGAEVTIKVKLDTAERQGHQEKKIVVMFHDDSSPIELVLVSYIPVALRAFPSNLEWKREEPASTKQIALQFVKKYPIKIKRIYGNNKNFVITHPDLKSNTAIDISVKALDISKLCEDRLCIEYVVNEFPNVIRTFSIPLTITGGS